MGDGSVASCAAPKLRAIEGMQMGSGVVSCVLAKHSWCMHVQVTLHADADSQDMGIALSMTVLRRKA